MLHNPHKLVYNLHRFVKTGKLHLVPKARLTTAALMVQDEAGCTPMHMLAQHGQLEHVPDSAIFASVLQVKDIHGLTPLHWLATFGRLQQLPAHLLTEKLMTIKDNYGRTPLHLGTGFTKLPKGLITKEAMLVADAYGLSPIHNAALKGYLDQLPKELVVLETLLAEERDGDRTTLHFAVASGHIDQLLGVDFVAMGPGFEEVKAIVGEDWWKQNLEMIRRKSELIIENDSQEVDLF